MLEFTLLSYAVCFFISVFLPFENIFYYVTSAIIHESGHYICTKILSIRAKKIRLTPLAAVIDIEDKSKTETLTVSLAGPFFNIITSVFLLAFFGEKLYSFALISFFIGILNLFPIGKLDGFVVLEILLSYFFSKEISKKMSDFISDIILVSFVFAASYRMLKYGDSVLSFLFSIRCIFASRDSEKSNEKLNWIERIKEK